MKDFKSQYYISNIPWQRKLNYDSIIKFNISYTDIIIFHFDLLYSILKIDRKAKGYSKNIFVAVINACLRYYQIIKKLYPYNKIKIIIHTKESMSIVLDYAALRSILDLLPNFAVCLDIDEELFSFDKQNYKHIIYGSCSNLSSKYKTSEKQNWSTIQGNLIIR